MLQPEARLRPCCCLILHPSCTGQTSRTCTGCPVRNDYGAAIEHGIRASAVCCCLLQCAHRRRCLVEDTFQKEESMYSATGCGCMLRGLASERSRRVQ
jgi:hypothetical protein